MTHTTDWEYKNALVEVALILLGRKVALRTKDLREDPRALLEEATKSVKEDAEVPIDDPDFQLKLRQVTRKLDAIEIFAGTESQPVSFNRNLHDQLINPDGSRNTTDAAKAFIKDAITSGSLDRNNNGVLDLQDAQRILRDGLGTYPGDSATAGLREPPVPAGTTNSELINEQEQLDAIDDSLEAIALMADAGPQFMSRGGGGSC